MIRCFPVHSQLVRRLVDPSTKVAVIHMNHHQVAQHIITSHHAEHMPFYFVRFHQPENHLYDIMVYINSYQSPDSSIVFDCVKCSNALSIASLIPSTSSINPCPTASSPTTCVPISRVNFPFANIKSLNVSSSIFE